MLTFKLKGLFGLWDNTEEVILLFSYAQYVDRLLLFKSIISYNQLCKIPDSYILTIQFLQYVSFP